MKRFRSLFRGRDDVYAVRWEGRGGKAGYSPACRKVWGGSFQKYHDEAKDYFPLTDQVIHDHLTGKITAGVYPLLTDETCWFLAADFDKATWQDDVRAFLDTCDAWKVPAVLERSRSGRGGHVWIFFEAPLLARLARNLGAAILTRTMERRHQLGLDSYDRFFPSQDTMPKGGFGNLIALPLQHLPRANGNSVFLDAALHPHADQWAFLSGARRMSFAEVETLVRNAERVGDILGIRRSTMDEGYDDDPWTKPPSGKSKGGIVAGPLPEKVRVVRGNMVFVEKDGLPSALLNRLHRLAAFLNLPIKSVGQIGGGRRRPTGTIDVAIIQSLNRKQIVDDVIASYGHVIVDECHLVSAVSFEQVLRQVKARYVTGLTATPQRKDGHHPIIVMQCGPIWHRVDAKEQAASRPFTHLVILRPTNFRLPPSIGKPEMHELYAALATDKARNELVCVDLLRAIKAGRSPILLTERTSQVDEFAARLTGLVKHIVVLKGGMSAKQRRAIAEQLEAVPDGEERVLLATGRYIGEGFDDARLDTLFLAMPISWRGTLQQYVGRLHRLHASKREVIVYDYVDDCIPVFSAMYAKRVRGYEAVGYSMREPE